MGGGRSIGILNTIFQFFYKSKTFPKSVYFKSEKGIPLVVQWLRLGTFTTMGPGSIPGRGTKIPQAMWCGQNKNKN